MRFLTHHVRQRYGKSERIAAVVVIVTSGDASENCLGVGWGLIDVGVCF
ncbi:hypothetical protein RSSM_02479 [Rhodopirellula sallentina SM41]|uniref:Uncharacterized protein n=1 Tax=Rhodopirellula sallentina SM41 TaxID=1263870 RepID=M5U4E5_9BACT|nr:hypothetical protein RSSM_02479 [Rhodopirellula sallentina SM41]